MRPIFIPLLRPTVEETLSQALRDAEAASYELLKERRQVCMDYYHNEVVSEDGGKDLYLKDFSSVDSKDGKIYKKTLLLEHVNLTEQVIDLKSRIYREQPIRSIDGEEAENYTQVLSLSSWPSIVKRLEQYTNLLHDVALGIFWDKTQKIFQYQVIPEYIPIFDEDDSLQINPVAIIYPTAKRTKQGAVVYAYYDDKTHVEMTKDGSKTLEESNTYGILNFVFSHRKYPVINHFSTPAINLIQANQAVDAAMTALNQLLHYNGFKQIVIKGKVAKENEQGLEVKFGLGNAKVITLEPDFEGKVSGDVSALDLQIEFDQHINAIKSKMEFVANEYNIQFQWKIDGDASSGVAFEMQNVRDYEDRRGQFDPLMDFVERPLYKIVSQIGSKFGLKIERGDLSVNFAEPKTEMSVTDKVLWQKWMKESGQWDLADLMVENNPELTREEAVKIAQERDAEKRRELASEENQNQPGEQDNTQEAAQ